MPKSGRDQGLGFAASENCRAVSARQHADFDPDIANLIELAAIGTALLLDHLLAEDALAQHLQVALTLLAAVVIFVLERLKKLVFQRLDKAVAFGLGIFLGIHGVEQAIAVLGAQFR